MPNPNIMNQQNLC